VDCYTNVESAESSPMQYNNSGLKLSFFGKLSLYYGKFIRLFSQFIQ